MVKADTAINTGLEKEGTVGVKINRVSSNSNTYSLTKSSNSNQNWQISSGTSGSLAR